MKLRIFTFTLDADRPRLDALDELRPFLAKKNEEFTGSAADQPERSIHRYPVVQCKIVRDRIVVTGVNEGAEFLCHCFGQLKTFRIGGSTCTVDTMDPAIREEPFGVFDIAFSYEFLTPWLALNQQNAKKFYDLNGKPERDAFMHAILLRTLSTFAKSLGYEPAATAPISCEHTIRFRKERIEKTNVIVFTGKFRTNLKIPDYLGIGQSVSKGFGAVRCLDGGQNCEPEVAVR